MSLVRTTIFTLASVGLAVTAHRLGGGAAPQAAVTGVAAGSLFLVGLVMFGREHRGWQIAALVLATQAALHVTFALAGASRTAGPDGSQTAGWANLLFCHHGPQAISSAEVAAV